MKTLRPSALLPLMLALLAGPAAAHPGHDANGLLVALVHALGLERLLMPVEILGMPTPALLLLAACASAGVTAGAALRALWQRHHRRQHVRA